MTNKKYGFLCSAEPPFTVRIYEVTEPDNAEWVASFKEFKHAQLFIQLVLEKEGNDVCKRNP